MLCLDSVFMKDFTWNLRMPQTAYFNGRKFRKPSLDAVSQVYLRTMFYYVEDFCINRIVGELETHFFVILSSVQ